MAKMRFPDLGYYLNSLLVGGLILGISVHFFFGLLFTIPVCRLFGFTTLQRFIQRKTKGLYNHGVLTIFSSLNESTFYFYVPLDYWDGSIKAGGLRQKKLAQFLANVRDESMDSIVNLTYAPKIKEGQKVNRDILVTNHQHTVDWCYTLYFVQRLGRIEDISILLKESILNIPFIGPVRSQL